MKKIDLNFIALKKRFKMLVNKTILCLLGQLIHTRKGRSLFFASLPKNELLIANTNEGLHYIVNSSDDIIGKSIFRDKISFDSNNLLLALKLIGSRRSILIDIGANIGTIGILAMSKNLFTKCLAFEPEPNNFKMLSANVVLNGLSEKFELHNEALSNELTESLRFELSKNNYGDHRIRVTNREGLYGEDKRDTITVRVNTLDNVCRSINPDDCVIFLDAQGFEGHILSGAKSFVGASVPIVTEFWPYGLLRSDGLDMFYSIMELTNYTSMYDLRQPEKKLIFSIDGIRNIANELGTDGAADLVFIRQ